MTYKTKRGRSAKPEMGVVTRITTNVPTNTEPIMDKTRNVIGNLASMTSMSLLNLFIILPTGVESKNDIGDRKIL